jgi:hypothetical protein
MRSTTVPGPITLNSGSRGYVVAIVSSLRPVELAMPAPQVIA